MKLRINNNTLQRNRRISQLTRMKQRVEDKIIEKLDRTVYVRDTGLRVGISENRTGTLWTFE